MKKQTYHGLSYTPEYKAWQTMRLRCTVPTNQAYPSYGGRGITVCDRWKDDVAAFVEDMGLKPSPKHELDRIDNDKGYSPENCRWVTRSENDRNRRSNRWLTYNGQSMTLVELSDISGVKTTTLSNRLDRGWSVEDAADTPVRFKAKKGEGVKKPPQVNKTGYPGVKFRKGKYKAVAMVNKVRRESRSFPTAEEAYEEYLRMKSVSQENQ